MSRTFLAAITAGALMLTVGAASAQEHGEHADGATKSLQGDAQSWFDNPHMHEFYAASVAAMANGAEVVDMEAYAARSNEIFTVFAVSMDMEPVMMLDHLKLIPGQVVEIAKEDPSILESYANFVRAMHGPE